jgi:hypothetical protein
MLDSVIVEFIQDGHYKCSQALYQWINSRCLTNLFYKLR